MWRNVEYEVTMESGKLVVKSIFILGRLEVAKMETSGFEDNRFVSTKIINEHAFIIRINYKKFKAIAFQYSKKED